MNGTNATRTEPIKRDTLVDLFNGMMKMARDADAFAEYDKIADYDCPDCFCDNAKKTSHLTNSKQTLLSITAEVKDFMSMDTWS